MNLTSFFDTSPSLQRLNSITSHRVTLARFAQFFRLFSSLSLPQYSLVFLLRCMCIFLTSSVNERSSEELHFASLAEADTYSFYFVVYICLNLLIFWTSFSSPAIIASHSAISAIFSFSAKDGTVKTSASRNAEVSLTAWMTWQRFESIKKFLTLCSFHTFLAHTNSLPASRILVMMYS